MVGDFLNIWCTYDGQICEKVAIRLVNYKNVIHSRGIYVSNIPVKYNNGQLVECVLRTNDIFRTFKNIEDADSYLKLTFEEFTEKYPKHEGKARFGKIFYINGKRFSND